MTLPIENKNDDFKDHFQSAFNQKNRRLSFEDNILLLFSSALMTSDDKINRKLSIDKKQRKRVTEEVIEEEDDYVDTIFDYTRDYVMIK